MREIFFYITALSLLGVLVGDATLAAAEGTYSRRTAKRGEVTDTHAKLSAFAFINDELDSPLKLRLFVDAGRARNAFDENLIPLQVGLAYGGKGPPLPIRPGSFQLTFEDDGASSPLPGLNNHALFEHPRGRASLRTERVMASGRVLGLPFDGLDGLAVNTQFYSDPLESPFVHDLTQLVPGTWFVDRVFFLLPAGLDLSEPLFRLSFRKGPEGAELISVKFRIEESQILHRKAFRRARKNAKKADKRERRHQRKLRRQSGQASP